MSLKIQMAEYQGVLPYPYFIDKDGLVGRQEFWKGRPYRLIGFSANFDTGNMELPRREFFQDPQKAVGMYPIFADQNDDWETHGSPVDRVTGGL